MIDPFARCTRRSFVQGVASATALGTFASWPAQLLAATARQPELDGTDFDLEIAELSCR